MNKGCYGSAICNNPNSDACKVCSLFEPCYELSKASLERIKEKGVVDVSAQERRNFQYEVSTSTNVFKVVVGSSKRQSLTDYQRAIVNNPVFPVKARKLVGSLFRKGITGKYIRNLLESRVNPFLNETPTILDIACRLILSNQFGKRSLRIAFEGSGQGSKTALSQTHTVIHTFMLMGVIDKTLKLRGRE